MPCFVCRVGQNRIHNTIYDCIFGDFPAKNTVYTPYIYGSGQPYLYGHVSVNIKTMKSKAASIIHAMPCINSHMSVVVKKWNSKQPPEMMPCYHAMYGHVSVSIKNIESEAASSDDAMPCMAT